MEELPDELKDHMLKKIRVARKAMRSKHAGSFYRAAVWALNTRGFEVLTSSAVAPVVAYGCTFIGLAHYIDRKEKEVMRATRYV